VTRKTSIASFLNFEEHLLVRACGALLSYLLEEEPHSTMEMGGMAVNRGSGGAKRRFESAATFRIASLTRLELDGRLHLDSSVYEYLQIFHAEHHPSAFGGSAKEGVSLFSLLNSRCASKAGVQLLKQWLLAPLSDPSIINDRLDTIDCLWSWISDENDKLLHFHLRHACDLRLALSRLSSGTSTCKDWIHLKEMCNTAIRVREMVVKDFSSSPSLPELFHRILLFDDTHLYEMHALVSDSLELSATKDGKPEIRGGVDSELDRLRSIHNDLDGFLDRIAKRELSKFPGVSSLRVVYVPQIGFQVVIPCVEHLSPSHPENPILQFASNQWAYYRTNATQEMDEMLGDVSPLISDRVAAVIRSISELVLKCHRVLLCASRWLAELDVLCSFAKVSRENGLVRPVVRNPLDSLSSGGMSDSHWTGELRIIGGRHVLLEMVLNSSAQRCVANSSYLGACDASTDRSRAIQVVLGANGSGKSVYLAQVGLVVYMAHVGCYVAAEEAELCAVDQIFAFCGRNACEYPRLSVESGEEVRAEMVTGSGSGSFANDVCRMGRMLRHATPLSLLLIDEFGRGTTEADAESLLIAFINKLATPRPLRTEDQHGLEVDSEGIPKCILASHFTHLLHHDTPLQRLESIIAYYHMNVIVKGAIKKTTGDKGEEATTPTFLYQLTSLQSINNERQLPLHLGISCSESAGIKKEVIERAKQIRRQLMHNRNTITPMPDIAANNFNGGDYNEDDDNGEELDDDDDKSHSRTGTSNNFNEGARQRAKHMEMVLQMMERNFGRESLDSMDTIDAITFMSMAFPKPTQGSPSTC